MSLSSLLTKLSNARGALVEALGSKGVTVESSATILSCAEAIRNLTLSSGAEVTLGYITSGGEFQALTFSGTSAADSGSAVTLSCYTWNLPGTDPSKTSSGVIISSGNHMYVDSGWTYTSTTVHSQGLTVRNGGIATFTTVYDYGMFIISSGGIATFTTVDDCGQFYINGGTANSTIVNSGGYAAGQINGTLNYTTVNSGGSLNVFNHANSTTVNPGGEMMLQSGASAADITVSSGGTLTIYTGAQFSGLNNLPGANVINS